MTNRLVSFQSLLFLQAHADPEFKHLILRLGLLEVSSGWPVLRWFLCSFFSYQEPLRSPGANSNRLVWRWAESKVTASLMLAASLCFAPEPTRSDGFGCQAWRNCGTQDPLRAAYRVFSFQASDLSLGAITTCLRSLVKPGVLLCWPWIGLGDYTHLYSGCHGRLSQPRNK